MSNKNHLNLPEGEFIQITESDFDEEKRKKEKYQRAIETRKIRPRYSEDLIKQYKFFRKNIYNPQRVFHPCCDTDISPIKGFPNSEVILMDKDKDVARIMEKNNISNFIHGNVLKHNPKNPYDLVIILNPQLKSSDLTKHLVSGGYVLANNWHDNATELLEDENFQNIGTIDFKRFNRPFLAKGDFSKLEPEQWEIYFYVFQKLNLK